MEIRFYRLGCVAALLAIFTVATATSALAQSSGDHLWAWGCRQQTQFAIENTLEDLVIETRVVSGFEASPINIKVWARGNSRREYIATFASRGCRQILRIEVYRLNAELQ